MELNAISQPIFGKWYIDEEIGSGAFGTVYRIKRESFEKTYYSALKVIRIPQNKADIKILRTELGDDDSLSTYYTNFVRDFAKEIELMSELKGQTNIVSYEDHDFIQEADGISWTVLIRMELLTPFADYQLAHEMSVADTVKLGEDICTALSVCENRNIIHRDIKLGNIFISDNGAFKLGDFGIARELEKTTGGLSKKGTYNYMAPEVYLGKPYNNTVDLYSLGIVLYKLLNRNRAPFLPAYPKPVTFDDREEALKRRVGGESVPAIPDVPAELNAIVKKACAFDPKERYATAAEMRAALQAALPAAVSVAEQKQVPSVSPVSPRPTGETEKTTGLFNEAGIGSYPLQTPAVNRNFAQHATPNPLQASISQNHLPNPPQQSAPFGTYGNTAYAVQPPVSQSAHKPDRKPLIITMSVIGVLLVIGAVIAALLLFGNSRIEDTTQDTTQFAQQEEAVTDMTSIAEPQTPDTTETQPATTTAATTTTTIATTAQEESTVLDTMTSAEKKAMNTFLSNFSEVELTDYDQSYIDEEAIINFAFRHGYVNKSNNIRFSDDVVTIDKDTINKYAKRFFGVKITPQDTDICEYYDDQYHTTTATLDSTCYYSDYGYGYIGAFSTVSEVKELRSGTYEIHFVVSRSFGKVTDDCYGYSLEQVQNSSTLTQIGYGTATVKVKRSDFADSFQYQLLKYEINYE